jgi:organic hydroperoxide reductase OsmC/OhrA
VSASSPSGGRSGHAGPVHHYRTAVTWAGSTGVGYDHYDRGHSAVTDPPTVDLVLSGDPAFGGDATRLDPEQLLVTAAASCQLLSFLAVAARARVDVIAYDDDVEAFMPEDDRPVRITRITLRPRITVAVAERPDAEGMARLDAKIRRLVDVAHRECFIANSLRSDIVIEPAITVMDGTPERR